MPSTASCRRRTRGEAALERAAGPGALAACAWLLCLCAGADDKPPAQQAVDLRIGIEPRVAGVEYAGWDGATGPDWRDPGDGSETRFTLAGGDYFLLVCLFDSTRAEHRDDRLAVSLNGHDLGTFQRGKADGWSIWQTKVEAGAFRPTGLQVLRFVRTGKPIAVKYVQICSWLPPRAPAPTGGLQRTGWNVHARRFLYAPTFEVVAPAGARRYVLGVAGAPDGASRQVKSDTPAFDLAGIWDDLPHGRRYSAWIQAFGQAEQPLGTTRTFSFFKVAPFAGKLPPAKCGYVDSGRRCAEYVMQKWLAGWKTDEGAKAAPPNYPCLFYSAFIRLLTTYAGLDPQSPKAREATATARKIGLRLIETSTPGDWAYPNMPLSHKPGRYLQVSRTAMAGMAYVDLAAGAADKAFLEAALRIAETLEARQLPDGRWYFRVDPRTGRAAEDYTSDQAEAIVFLDRLIREHGRKDLVAARDRAVRWMLDGPVKTRHWQQQWDDVPLKAPYTNLEFYDTVFFGLFLLRHATAENGYQAVAAELFRYVEDQFVLWESSYNPGFISPSVKEQYLCYQPIDWHAAHFIRFCMGLHQATGDGAYLDKARAMADSLTVVQHPDGFYPTWMRRKGAGVDYGGIWPNCTSYTGEMLIRFGKYVEKLGAARGAAAEGPLP